MEKLARITQRECDGASEVINVIARSVSDEAIHLFCRAAMDCFASLVMTALGLFENGIGSHLRSSFRGARSASPESITPAFAVGYDV